MDKTLLTEGISPIVYHATNMQSAFAILAKKRFSLTVSIGSSSEEFFKVHPDYHYYMSVFRSIGAVYHKGWTHGVIFQLNGEWFNQRYPGKSVDYFYNHDHDKIIKNIKKKKEAGEPVSDWDIPPPILSKGKELEDRIFSKTQYIDMGTSINNVITALHLYLSPSSMISKSKIEYAIKTITLAKKYGIPFYLYDNETSWQNHDTRNTKPLEWLTSQLAPIKAKEKALDAAMVLPDNLKKGWLVPFGKKPYDISLRSYEERNPVLRIKRLLELYYQTDPKQLDPKTKSWFTYYRNVLDLGIGIEDVIISTRKKHDESIKREMDKLLSIWRDLKISKPEEYAKFLMAKWEPLLRPNLNPDLRINLDKPRLVQKLSMNYAKNAFNVNKKALVKKQRELAAIDAIQLLPEENIGNMFSVKTENTGIQPFENKSISEAKKEKQQGNAKNDKKVVPTGSATLNVNITAFPSTFDIKENIIGNQGRFIAYHGSNKRFSKFSTKMKRIDNDFFGGGIGYFTDEKKVALTYSKAMTRRYGGEEYLYKVELVFHNLFDVDSVFTGEPLKDFLQYIKPEALARGAGLLKAGGEDKYTIIGKLEAGTISITGHDLFRGLSGGMINSGNAEAILKKMGYDGLRYNGGLNMDAFRHNVYIPYYENSVHIQNVFKVNRTILKEAVEIPPISGMTFGRELLPQIKDGNDFLDHLKLIGVEFHNDKVSCDDLKATQSDGMSKVKISKLMGMKSLPGTVLASNDGYILDGHHRWAACWNQGEKVPVTVIDLPILELIRIGLDYCNQIIDESYTFGRIHDVLYHHLDYRKALNCIVRDKMEKRWTHTLPNLHIKQDPSFGSISDTSSFSSKPSPGKKIQGNSFSRNINLSYASFDKRLIFELDRKKLMDTNRIHVVDADMAVNAANPHASLNKLRDSFGQFNARQRAIDYHAGKDLLSNEFAEEFVEGDIAPLHKYIRTIWLKDDKNSFNIRKMLYDNLAQYLIQYPSIQLKYFPSGKDAMGDLLDWVNDEIEDIRNNEKLLKQFNISPVSSDWEKNGSKGRASNILHNIRKSVSARI